MPALYQVASVGIFVPSVVICPEPDAGDSWGYCIAVPSQSDAGSSSANGLAAGGTYNDGAGT